MSIRSLFQADSHAAIRLLDTQSPDLRDIYIEIVSNLLPMKPLIPHVLCLGGSATIDQIFYVTQVPAPSAKVAAREFVITGGGVAANAAVAVQRLGGQAAYWGRVGQDAWGDQVMVMLAREGINIQYLRQLPGYRTKVSSILIDEHGERLVVSAQPQGYPDVVDWLPLKRVAEFHAVLADTRWVGGAQAILDAAAQQGLPSVLDGDSGDVSVVRQLVQRATHPVLSEATLARLAGLPDQSVLTIEQLETGLRRAMGGRNQICGVTLGNRGVVWVEQNTLHQLHAPKIKAVDTLAAGDTWHGALALALARGDTTAQAMRFATLVAACKCTRMGGRQGIPNADELREFVANLGSPEWQLVD